MEEEVIEIGGGGDVEGGAHGGVSGFWLTGKKKEGRLVGFLYFMQLSSATIAVCQRPAALKDPILGARYLFLGYWKFQVNSMLFLILS